MVQNPVCLKNIHSFVHLLIHPSIHIYINTSVFIIYYVYLHNEKWNLYNLAKFMLNLGSFEKNPSSMK